MRIVAEYDHPRVRVEGVIVCQDEPDEDGFVWLTVRDEKGAEHLIRSEEVISV